MVLTLKTADMTTELGLWRSADQSVAIESWESGRQLADDLLPRIERLLSGHDAVFKDLAGLVVFAGPGSFTSLRIGLTVANTIAYANDCPIVSASGDDWIKGGFIKLKSAKSGDFTLPEYGAEANITQPKK